MPQTPLGTPLPIKGNTPPTSITKKGKDGNFQEVLFETIEDFEQRRRTYGDNSDLRSIGKLLLPLDVYLLYDEHKEISEEFSQKISNEKKIVDSDIDDFLKEIILMMEKVKEKLYHKIDLYHQSFFDYYSNFIQRIEEFLKGSISMISSSESMQNYQVMRKSVNENDPLSKEIGIFRKKKEQATQIEKLFRGIKDNYRGTKLNEMTKVLDKILSQEVSAYKQPKSQIFFKNHQAEFASKVMNDKRLSDDTIVNSFRIELGKEKTRPPVQQGHDVHRLRDFEAPKPNQLEVKSKGPRVHFMDGSEADPAKLKPIQLPKIDKQPYQENKPKQPYQEVKPKQPYQEVKPKKPQFTPVNINLPHAKPSEVQISPNNNEVILKYNPKKPKIQKIQDFKLPLNSAKITCIQALDTRNLVVGTKDGTLMTIDLERNPQIENFITKKLNLKSQINCIIRPEERQSTSLNPPPKSLFCALEDTSIAVLNFSGENATISRLRGHTGSVNFLIHYTPGKIFSCSNDGCVGLWDTVNQRAVSLTRVHSSKVNSICLMNSKKVLLTAGQDCKIGVYQVEEESGKLSQVTELKDYYPIKNVHSFHNNTNFAVATSDDGMIKVWNIDRKE